MKSQELVVARYKENLDWLDDPRLDGFKKTIYVKSGGAMPGTIKLPNEGREAHTYLTHIVRHYHVLDDFVTFCQGGPFDHCPDFIESVSSPPKNGFTGFGALLNCDEVGRPHCWDGALLPMGAACRNLSIPNPGNFEFFGGACFRVSRELIHRRPAEFYQRALDLGYKGLPGINMWSDKEGVNQWDCSHIFERLWFYIFSGG